MTLGYPLPPQAITRDSTIYKPQLVETRAEKSCYEPRSVTLGGLSNTNHNSYSQHKINTSLDTTCDCSIEWRPSVRALTRTLTLVPPTILSHNSRNATRLPSILSHNSRNVISSHNSRKAQQSPSLTYHSKPYRPHTCK